MNQLNESVVQQELNNSPLEIKTALIYDTETTGLPIWQEPSELESQPHIVQLAALLVDIEARRIISSIDLIIQPTGWEIPEETSELHGITTAMAIEFGVSEISAVKMFLEMEARSDVRVAHNKTFDQRIIRIATKRYPLCFSPEVVDEWSRKEDHDCTMLLSKPICQLLPKNRFGFKAPKLEEAYKHFTGKNMVNAHTAIADATACAEIYLEIKALERAQAEVGK